MIKNLVYYLICFSIQNIAQIEEINPVVVGQPEVYIQTSSSNAKTVEAELISTSYWFGLRNIFFTAEVNFNSTGGVVTVIDFSDQQKGWDWISEDNDNPSRGYIGWGLYKFHHFSSGSYFYIDYRDSDWERNYPPHTPDHYIFIEDEDIFYFAYTDNITPRSVENGERVNIWEEWGYSEPDYSDFPSDFWENSLGLDITNDYLVLLWIPRPNTSNITGYKIYRAFSPFYETTPDTDFYEIASTSININIFTDQALVPDTYSDRNNVYYKVEVITPSQSYITEFVQVGFSATTDWNSALICIKSGDHPYLTWAQYHRNDYVSGYKVYKKKNSSNYQLLATTTDLDYLDTSEYIYDGGGNKTYASYYVKAELTSGSLSPASNTVSAAVEDVGQVEKMTVTNNNEYEISLSNYPNPFNPETAINYSIPKSSLVNITVYDLLGRKIAELINEIKEAGSYEVNFNAENHPSGLYIYKLTANENIITKKMMLLR